MKTLSFKLPESLFAKLTSTAKERGESRSVLMREAIEAFIKEDNKSPKTSPDVCMGRLTCL